METREGTAPPVLQVEVRDDAGTLVAGESVDTASLGWNGDGRGREVRWDVPSLPLAEGRFHLRLGLSEADGGRLLHWLDDALTFLVYPAGEERGVVRLRGSWTLEQNSEAP